ncbi:hypothetical protein ADICYQ_0837 [Cyclobacterium qasimii M12-11B]|uniref:Uncharacterized protein n=1 Tax=Cyclobacterium qasimii M12-11B TaxID=641524 RepID=S7VLP0_9BACT|nr:hypothetical protein ADICYQ_0837 [Cyclobacterium qasimii M12-11B]
MDGTCATVEKASIIVKIKEMQVSFIARLFLNRFQFSFKATK